MSLVQMAGRRIGGSFRSLWRYQHLKESFNPKERAAIEETLKSFDPEVIAAESREMASAIASVNDLVSANLNLLTKERTGGTSPEEWRDFLSEFARSYCVKDGIRGAGPILRYMLTSCDNTFFIWRQWISACIAMEDYCSADSMLSIAQEQTEFSKAKAHHGHWLCAKAMILFHRDGDREEAMKLANRARMQFGDDPVTSSLYKALRDKVSIPADALLTGDWTHE